MNVWQTRKPTTKIWCESLPLVCAEEALLPEDSDLRADGIYDIADVLQFELLETLDFCL